MPAKATARFDARITAEHKELLERAQAINGNKSLADFIISSAVQNAKQIVQTEHMLQLSISESIKFTEALERPSKPNKALKQLTAKYESAMAK